jgi:hypothetical protein
VGLGQQAYVYTVLPKEVIQFLLPAADIVDVPADKPQDFSRRPFGRSAILGCKENDDFKHNSWASWPRRECLDECQEPTSELHTRLEVEVV